MSKKNSDEKKKLFDFYYTELTAMAEYFEKQEQEGYRLKRFDRKFMIFEKCEPRKIRYCAEIFRGSTPEEFVEACSLEGWELAAQYNGELYVFRTQKDDAIDIMTDKKEKNKICSRRILRQPGTWISLLYIVSNIIRLFTHTNSVMGINPFETDPDNFFFLFVISFFIFGTLIKVFDYFLWRSIISSSEYGEKSRFFSLKTTVNKRKIYDAAGCLFWIIGYSALIWICPVFLHKFSITFALIVIAGLCKSFFAFGKLNFAKKDSLKKTVLNSIIVAVAVCGVFAVSGHIEKRYAENLFSLKDIPVSVTDLDAEAGISEDKMTVKGTRFGRMYRFTSHADSQDSDESLSGYLMYYILVSDYPHVRQKYIDKISDDYSKQNIGLVKVSPPETQWDFYYKFKFENGKEYDAFAVKDNVVVYLRRPAECEKNFFDVVYKKLFA